MWEWPESPGKSVWTESREQRTEPPTSMEGEQRWRERQLLELNDSGTAMQRDLVMELDDVGYWLHLQNMFGF